MKKILLQLALLLVTFAANAQLTEWKNIVSTNFVTSISHDSKLLLSGKTFAKKIN